MSFSAGDATGRKHTFAKGLIRMWTPVAMASSSKFPVALAIAGAVVDGHLSFETRVHEVFSWWTSNATDRRSRVTLRQLLSFTSGLVVKDVAGGGLACMGLLGLRYSPEECAREIYDKGPFTAEPGTTWSYHSLHLQVAGAMAAKAAGLSIKELLEKYLLKRIGMTSSFWLGYPNPHLAAAMISTGNDYDKLLRSVLAYEILPRDVIDQMEADYTSPPVRASNFSKDQFLLENFGHYSMGTYFECVGQNWSDTCKRNGVHADPGAFAFWPLVNRKHGYYMQIVTMKLPRVSQEVRQKYHLDASTIAALPAMCTAPLRFGLQPFVERALGVASSSTMTSSSPGDLPQEVCKYVKAEVEAGAAEDYAKEWIRNAAAEDELLII